MQWALRLIALNAQYSNDDYIELRGALWR